MESIPACGDGCGLDVVEGKTRTIGELLTTEFPDIEWTCGSRCEKHNAKVGGSPTSGHLAKHGENNDETVALDGTVRPWNPWRVRIILWRAIQHGAKGIGYYPDSKHFHIDRKPRVQFWKAGPKALEYFFDG